MLTPSMRRKTEREMTKSRLNLAQDAADTTSPEGFVRRRVDLSQVMQEGRGEEGGGGVRPST